MKLLKKGKKPALSLTEFVKANAPVITDPQEELKKAKSNKLPSDEYVDLFDPIDIPLLDTAKIHVSCKRAGEMGLPAIDIRLFVKTDIYEGATKKGVNLPLDMLPVLQKALADMHRQADDMELFEEFEEEE